MNIDEAFPIITMQEIHDEHMRMIDEFGFMGDEDTPVEVEVETDDHYSIIPRWFKDGKRIHIVVMHSIRHAHSTDGKCLKSRWGLCNERM